MLLHSPIDALATALIASFWQGAALTVAAALAMTALRDSGARVRHAVALGALLAMPICAVMSFVSALLASDTSPIPRLPQAYFEIAPAPLISVWLAGIALNLLRLGAGVFGLRSLEQRSAEALPAEWVRRVESLTQRLGIRREVVVKLLPDVMPCTARMLRPVIWLPATLLTRMPPDQVEAIIAHELAHIRRMDWLWNGLQCVVETVMFYHPCVWWLGHQIRREREHACDDLAAGATGDTLVVAEALGALETIRLQVPAMVLAASGGETLRRVTRLLRPDLRPTRPWRMQLAGLTSLYLVAALALHLHSIAAHKITTPPPRLDVIPESVGVSPVPQPVQAMRPYPKPRRHDVQPVPAVTAPPPPPVPIVKAPPLPALPELPPTTK